MLYDLDSFAAQCGGLARIEDMTMVIALRAHDGNPWVTERLALVAGHYDPLPAVVVVDFGSQGTHRARVRSICDESGFDCVYEDDTGTFSPARGRNIGVARVATELVFFNDVDCFGERNMFRRLVDVARAIDLCACFDQIVNLPSYHLTGAVTRGFFEASPGVPQSDYLARVCARASYAPRRESCEFVAPYSNVFLCHRRFFELLGGFNEEFRGHGSEDFELLLRFARLSRQFPMPARAGEDLYGPLSVGFYDAGKRYEGFRRLFDLMGFQAESAGLRVAHLHHASPAANSWSTQSDRSRENFRAQVDGFIASERVLLSQDWLPRSRRAIAVTNGDRHVAQLMSLRLAGYELLPVDAIDAIDPLGTLGEEATSRALTLIDSGDVDAVVRVLELPGDPHGRLAERAERAGLEVILICPGDLPQSWEYRSSRSDGEVPRPEAVTLSETDLQIARDYLLGADDATRLSVQRHAAASAVPLTTSEEWTAFVAWLLRYRYSFFGDGDLQYTMSFRTQLWTRRAALSHRFDLASYAAGRLCVGSLPARERQSVGGGYGHGLDRPLAQGDVRRRLAKLARDPKRFLEESRFPALRWVGRRLRS